MDEDLKKFYGKFNDKLRKDSGRSTSEDPLVCFLYLLMRDSLPSGVVTAKVIESLNTDDVIFTNGYLANFAKYLASELKMRG